MRATTLPFTAKPRSGVPLPLRPALGARAVAVGLTVFRADTLAVLSGAGVRAVVFGYGPSDAEVQTGEGTTGVDGGFTVNIEIPSGKGIRFEIFPVPDGPRFGPKAVELPDTVPDGAVRAVAVCPAGADGLACEVGERQLLFGQVLDQQLCSWRGGEPSAKVMEFAVDTAHFSVKDGSGPVGHPLLAKHWDALSWGVCDLGIPPSDWPELVRSYDAMWNTLDRAPWPESEEVRLALRSCIQGLPLAPAAKAVGDFRLYAPIYSDYFPRREAEIRRDVAASFLLNMHLVFECMERRILDGKSLRKGQRHLAGIRLAAASLSPGAVARAAYGPFVTDHKDFVLRAFGRHQAAVPSGMAAGLSGTGGAEFMLREIVKGGDPELGRAAENLAGACGGGVHPDAIPSGAHMARIADFVRGCPETDPEGRLCAEVAPFIIWCAEALGLDRAEAWRV